MFRFQNTSTPTSIFSKNRFISDVSGSYCYMNLDDISLVGYFILVSKW